MDVSRRPEGAPRRRSVVLLVGVLAGVGVGWGLGAMGRARAVTPEPPKPAGPTAEEPRLAVGRELFHREWMPGDPRARGGDGLGPVYNDSSCVACHNLGGPGGGGPANKNIDIVTSPSGVFSKRLKTSNGVKKAMAEAWLFANAPSAVLHRFGTNPDFAPWRVELLGTGDFAMLLDGRKAPFDTPLVMAQAELAAARPGGFALTPTPKDLSDLNRERLGRTKRNTTALFGAGLIDAIPEAAITEAVERKFREFPEVTGRVIRPDGKSVGRFGWKAQTASLAEFVRAACSNELGLDVPGHAQAADPLDPDYRAPGLDLDDDDCDALPAYVRGLPAPAGSAGEPEAIRAGREAFSSVGCTACHLPDLGPARGIYSDLSLHDMGRELSDAGRSYGGTVAPSTTPKAGGQVASASEWRTPPLWGVRDSAPYLHDGRADTLEQAIAFHGGEAQGSADRYFGLPPGKRRQLLAFLNTLGAPEGSKPRAD